MLTSAAGSSSHPDRGGATPTARAEGHRLVGLIDWFIPESATREADELRRARLAIGGILIGILAFSVMTLVQSSRGSLLIAGIVLFALVAFVFVLAGFRRTGSMRLLAYAIPGLLFLWAVVVMITTSGHFVGSLYGSSTLIPLAAVMLAGWRAGLAWTLAYALAAGLLLGAAEWRQAPLFVLDPSQLEASNLRGTILMAAVSLGVAVSYEWLRTGAMREAQNARRELELYRGRLQDRVEERTRELDDSRRQLVDNQRLAGIGTLAAGIAHQINNPIGAILAAAQFSRSTSRAGDIAPDIEGALADIESEAQRCGRIVHDLLQFARNEPLEKRVEDVNFVLQWARNATQSYTRERSGAVTVTPSAEPALVEMNPIAIEQVFVNLIRNGLEARSDGAVVECSVAVEGRSVLVRVRDNGDGIAPEMQQHLFDPFFTTRTLKGGTGLGLSVSHGIVREHGGQVRIDSQPGERTTFVVELPYYHAEVRDVASP